MTKTVTLPLWLAVLLGIIVAWAIIDRIVIPLVRGFFGRREERFLHKVKARFHLLIPAFKVTRRRTLVERLISDPQVLAAVDDYCDEHKAESEDVLKRVRVYAEEIIPNFHAFVYYYLGSIAGRIVAQLLYRVRRMYIDEARLKEIPQASSLVFLMNHRSHMDYILLGYLTQHWAPPSFAAGEWAGFWPVRPLIKAMGAYFVRRGSNDPLYRKVLAAYIQMATEGGQVQAVYLEGRLTLDGKIQEPKVGILDYILRSFDPDGTRDVIFIPVGVNYDRVLEDRSQVMDQVPGAKKRGSLGRKLVTLRFIGKNLWLMVRGAWHRFGYAILCFGIPISLRDYVRGEGIDFRSLDQKARSPYLLRLGRELLTAVGRVVPVAPVSLVSSLFVAHPERTFSQADLRVEVKEAMDRLREKGAPVYLPRGSVAYTVEVGVRTLVLRHLVLKDEEAYTAVPREMPLLNYYANALAHFTSLPGRRD